MSSFVLLGVAVLGLNAYAAALVLLRARVYDVRLYRPMLVNIALSILPLAVAVVLPVGGVALVLGSQHVPRAGRLALALLWVFLIVAAAVWLLFFPNAVYLITELNLSHRRPEDPVPLWFDIVQTLTLTLSGIANALVSLGVIQLVSVILFDSNRFESYPPWQSWLSAGVVLVLGSIGIYLGRYLRFNSWDVRHPASMGTKTRNYFSTPGRVPDFVAFVSSHSLMLALLYVPLFSLSYTTVAG